MSEVREGQIWKERTRGVKRHERYLLIKCSNPARVYVEAITVYTLDGKAWLRKRGARCTYIFYGRFNGKDFVLHQDVAA